MNRNRAFGGQRMAKTPKKTGFSLQGFDADHYRQTEGYVQAIDALYSQAVGEYAKIASKVNVDPAKVFSFSDYPQAKQQAQQIINQLAAKMQAVIVKGSREQWLYACKKNDEFLKSILKTSNIKKSVLNKYQDRNLEALESFQKRKVAGLDLSQRVWNYAGQMKTQMELGIDIALGEGKSAQALSRDLRQYLVDPDKLFRKVKDKHGNLVLSKNAKAFHPGQGKYRSSYKNAMRLTRSEINMSYRVSDQLRWQQLDFVVGYEVRLSNNHTTLINGVPTPFVDICDDLKGKYPKSFVFKGWHPQCRCGVYPILQDRDEFNTDELNELKSALNGTEYKKLESRNRVTDVPENFKQWVSANIERSQNWTSQPYFIRDNFKGGNMAGGLKFATKPVKPVKSEAQKADIQNRWNQRVNSNQYGQQLKNVQDEYSNVPSLQATVAKIQNQIKAGATTETVAGLINKLNKKIEVKKAWDESQEIRQLATLLDNPQGLVNQFGKQAVKDLYQAVQAKLKQWEGTDLQYQKKKLIFEIDWVQKNQKYDTWKCAQAAYKKQLAKVEYQIEKIDVQASVAESLKYAKTTKSPIVKQLAGEIEDLLSKNAPLQGIKSKVDAINAKVEVLNKEKAAVAAKKATENAIKTEWDDNTIYSQKRKDAALWAKIASSADNKVRDVCGQVWRGATMQERDAAYYYTHTYSSINEPLRGIKYAGDKDLQLSQSKVPHLTSIIEKSQYDFDMWLQRGVDSNGFRGLFGVDINYMSTSELSTLVGKTGTDKGFSSCGVAKGKGFKDKRVIYNIYCPRGTKMLYLEPFSLYGKGTRSVNWDGISRQSQFSQEAEMLIQRGTKFRITKAEYNNGKYYVDIEVIGQ